MAPPAQHPDGITPPPSIPPGPSDDFTVLLGRALERQTDTLAAEVRALGTAFTAGVHELRAEGRAARRGYVLLLALLIIVLGGALGLRTGFDVPGLGAANAAPAAAPP